MKYSLRFSGKHYNIIRDHLFSGDGLEAIAFAICGRHKTDKVDLLIVSKIVLVPHQVCKRGSIFVTWPTNILTPYLDEVKKKNLAIVKIHSHPVGCENFSDYDDLSDLETFRDISNWLDDIKSHASVIMLPDGRMIGRIINGYDKFTIATISVAGDDIYFWHSASECSENSSIFYSQLQLFGKGTTEKLSKLKIGLVGCSGTGSIVLEQLARLGVKQIVLIDHDNIEDRNLNRITNSKKNDIGKPKVDILADAIESIGIGTEVLPLSINIFDPQAVSVIAECDIIFSCVDTAEGRQILNRISTFYVIPFFDVGIHLKSDGKGGISEASGVVHYIQPGGSSLLSRKAITRERIRAENLYRTDPEAYAAQFKAGYIEDVKEQSPAVISLNSTVSSLAVDELLARIHSFRSCYSSDAAIIRVNFMETILVKEEEGEPCKNLAPFVGRGTTNPLLDMPSLST